MAYVTGDIILDDEYNIFATGNAAGTGDNNVANINTIWGIGNGDKGYGQTTTLTAVDTSTTVTATQWSTLVARLNSILTHQSGSGSGITAPEAGNVIAVLSNLSTNISTAFTNRLNFNSTRGTTTTGSNFDNAWADGGAGLTSITRTLTVTFASSDQARYFFNSGGRLSLVLTPVDFNANTKENQWAALVNAVGTIHLDAYSSTRTGTGETVTTNGLANGYWELGTSNTTLLRLTNDTSPYTANYIDILARVAGTAGSNGGKGTQIIFDITYVDGSDDFGFNDAVSGTLRQRIDIVRPETTNLSDVWGTITVA
jgi:hypothetical protein